MTADLQSRIKAQGMELALTDEVKDFIAKDGYNPTYGARPLRRSIQRLLEESFIFGIAQSATYQHGGPVSDVRRNYFAGQCGAMALPKHGIDRMNEIEARINQGSIQVEDDQPHCFWIKRTSKTRHGTRITHESDASPR